MDTNTLDSTVQWPATSYYDEDDNAYDTDYRDSGEGGLMVYAVWGYYEQTAPSVLNETFLNMGEVFVSASGPVENRVREFLDELRAKNWRDAMGSNRNFSASSVVLFGSTGQSLYSDRVGSYFQVTRENLTESGFALLTALEALYGREATLVTFLDT